MNVKYRLISSCKYCLKQLYELVYNFASLKEGGKKAYPAEDEVTSSKLSLTLSSSSRICNCATNSETQGIGFAAIFWEKGALSGKNRQQNSAEDCVHDHGIIEN